MLAEHLTKTHTCFLTKVSLINGILFADAKASLLSPLLPLCLLLLLLRQMWQGAWHNADDGEKQQLSDKVREPGRSTYQALPVAS
jgi:hypothetical protein